MLINGNLLVEVTPKEATLIRELLATYGARVRDGEISVSGLPADEAREAEALADRFYVA
jgi:hypothetical protein